MIWNDVRLTNENFENAKINPASIDLALSQYIRVPQWYWRLPLKNLVWRCLGKPSPWDRESNLFWRKEQFIGDIHHKNDWYWLKPGELVLLSAIQHTIMPNNCAGLLVTTSTAGRVGLNHSHSGWVDPGFEGHLTFEISNLSRWPIPLYSGLVCVQLVVMSLTSAAKEGYEKKGRYQNQTIIPQTAKKKE
jgi:deoxycytidine triphosphate deaminase